MYALQEFFNNVVSNLRTFQVRDLIDILVISFVFYELFVFARKSRAGQLVRGLVLLLVCFALAYLLELRTVRWLLNNFLQVGFIAAVVLFQPELRRALERLGQNTNWAGLFNWRRSDPSLRSVWQSAVVAICDAAQARKHSKKQINISFDEWNVWYHSHGHDQAYYDSRVWHEAPPLLEDIYTFEDALLVGSMLITLLKHADRVKVACLAQLVNVIAPIMTRPGGGAWCNTIYWPYMHASLYGRGTALQPLVQSPTFATKEYDAVPMLDSVAILNPDGGVTVFAVNRDEKEDLALNLDLRAFPTLKPKEHLLLHHDDMHAVNTEDNPNNVSPVTMPLRGDEVEIRLPARSWNVIRLG